MAKRAPILPENYNPVGERLRRITQPLAVPGLHENVADIVLSEPQPTPIDGDSPPAALGARKPIPEIPTDKELKDVSVRFRCTPSERTKWHEITRELLGDHNNLSHFIRAAMLLVENSQDHLKRLAPDMQRFRKPATTDALGIMLYEQQLAQFLYDAIRNTGRPKG